MKLCVTIENLSDAISNFVALLLGLLHDIQELPTVRFVDQHERHGETEFCVTLAFFWGSERHAREFEKARLNL